MHTTGEPAPFDIASSEQAEVFVYNGAEEYRTLGGGRCAKRPKMENHLFRWRRRSGITLLEVIIHIQTGKTMCDPHVWLDPMNARAEMSNILDAFVKADPECRLLYKTLY